MTKAELQKLDQIWSSLYGNGKPGLKTEVELLKQAMKEFQKSQDNAAAWLKAIAVVFFVQVAAVGIGLLTHTIDVVK